jgi:serine/threonine protein kinase
VGDQDYLDVDAIAAAFPELMNVRTLSPDQGNQKLGYYAEHDGSPIALFVVPFENPDCPYEPGSVIEIKGRLKREVDSLAAIDSPHVPKLGTLPSGTRVVDGIECGFFTEEYIEGESVADLLKDGAKLDLEDAAAMALGVAKAIREFAKGRRVHRDIKPANILRRHDGTFVLIDPGMVLDLDGPELTKSKALPGSLKYMSPEQVGIDSKHDLDFRSDAYSLGVVLYLAVSGQHPYGSIHMDVLEWIRTIRNDPPAIAAQVPDELQPMWSLITRLLGKRPHQRFLSTPDRLIEEVLSIREALQ